MMREKWGAERFQFATGTAFRHSFDQREDGLKLARFCDLYIAIPAIRIYLGTSSQADVWLQNI